MSVSDYTLTKIINDYTPDICNSRIDKITRTFEKDYCFKIHQNKNFFMTLSTNPFFPFLFVHDELLGIQATPNQFTVALKKYLEGGHIEEFKKIKDERIIELLVSKRMPNYQIKKTRLIFELFSHRPNLILLEEDYQIIDAIRKSESLDDKKPILKGLYYRFEENENKSISKSDNLESLKSKLIKKEYQAIEELSKSQPLENLIDNLLKSKNLYYSNFNLSFYPLSNAKKVELKNLYHDVIHSQESNLHNEQNHALANIVKTKIKSLAKKIKVLNEETASYQKRMNYAELGNLLYVYQDSYVHGSTSLDADGIIIKLDPSLDLNQNAGRYFKLYGKAKTGLKMVDEQISLATQELRFLNVIFKQIEFANNQDLEEITEDLAAKGYLKKSNPKKKNKKSTRQINPHFLFSPNKIKIGYGLSSLQNEYLTSELAHKDDIFLHLKDYTGPHVIIFDANPDQETLLFAAEVACYFAKVSGGEVIYTKKHNVKKVPSIRGLVTFTSYQTLLIKTIREKTLTLLNQ